MKAKEFVFDCAVVAWPHLAAPYWNPHRTKEVLRYSCALLTDFPKEIILAARAANGGVDPDYDVATVNAPTNAFRTWGFRYRIQCVSPRMPMCVGPDDRAIDPLLFTAGSRVSVLVDLEPGCRPKSEPDPDRSGRLTFVKCMLRKVTLRGGPIERAPSVVSYE